MSNRRKIITPEIAARVEELLAKMTLEEKIGQLNQVGPTPVGGVDLTLAEWKRMLDAGKITRAEYDKAVAGIPMDAQEDDVRAGRIGSFLVLKGAEKCNRMQRIAVEESRLGIPLLLGLDVVHGLRTIFPIPLAEACSWNEEVFENSAAIAAKEAVATGLNWTFAPMVDIARDARWGRIAEGAGEDPLLTSRFAAAKVRGFQGPDLSAPDRIAACAKHFAAYGAAIGGRDYNSADISLQTLHEVYLPPFEAASDAGAATFMGAFNDINGVPCTTNPYLYKDILRGAWGFDGMVVSDASAVAEVVAHGTAADRGDAAAQSLAAGMDMDMGCRCYIENLADRLQRGEISLQQIDDAVRHVLGVKFALGLFEHPYVDPTLADRLYLCAEHRAAARDAARRSMVLLKNDGLLPLAPDAKLLVVGGLAAERGEMLGTWAAMGRGEDTACLLDGLDARGVQYEYLPCYTVNHENHTIGEFDPAGLAEAIAKADFVIAALGETRNMSGEASSLCEIGLAGGQDALVAALAAAGKPFAAVLFNGRPLAIPHVDAAANAVLEAWHLGTEAGHAICDVLFGDHNPGGRLTVTFPHHTGECPRYYNHVSTGRPAGEIRHSCKYMDAPITPLYPFGHGLSYTEFAYENLTVREENGMVTAQVTVRNTGARAAEETVQLYVHDRVARRARPVRELKAFAKVWLEPGEEKRVELTFARSALGYYDTAMHFIVEPGDFDIWAGHDSTADLHAVLTVK
ncbi:MAG: beta-glucosidase BglX [Oscillospiraceae bacterium]|nr:beta-glucosidase BglX [Oscillospiraceae bacterium]